MYLELDEGFPKHRKTLRLRSIMRDPKAGWYMIDLWTWACRSCPSGDLTGISAYEIEEAANYPKCDGKLCQGMIDAGFIDVDQNGSPSSLHNWMVRTGGAIHKMSENAKNKKLFRAHKDGKCDRQSCEWCNHVQGQSKDSPKTGSRTSDTDQSRPVQTSPDQSSQERESLARDPGDASTEHQAPRPASSPRVRRPNGHDLVTMFGSARLEIFPETLPWNTARDKDGDAGSFAELLSDDEIVDLRETMRLALSKIKSGSIGWQNPEMAVNPSFAFGSWKSKFTGLREELHGRVAKVAKPEPQQRDGKPARMQARY